MQSALCYTAIALAMLRNSYNHSLLGAWIDRLPLLVCSVSYYNRCFYKCQIEILNFDIRVSFRRLFLFPNDYN
jgi:hypothetical protein